MKIPDSLRIGGVEYAIRLEPNVKVGDGLCYGKIDYGDSVITLSSTDGKGEQHRCITLWHEILHGIFEHACWHPEEEEQVVEVLSKGIYQVLMDNAQMLDQRV